MRIRNIVALTSSTLFVVAVLAGCGSGNTGSTPSASVSVSPSQSPSVSPAPTNTHVVANCPGFSDNSSTVAALPAGTEPVFYLFACYGERIIVRVDGGVGHVVHAPIQSEYNFGLIDFSGDLPIESIVYSNGLVSKNVPTYWGPAVDLHADKYARVAGPTTDVTDFYEQDCKDHMEMTGAKTCKKMKSGLAEFFKRGDESHWKNGLPN